MSRLIPVRPVVFYAIYQGFFRPPVQPVGSRSIPLLGVSWMDSWMARVLRDETGILPRQARQALRPR
jgi:hypothetical protein